MRNRPILQKQNKRAIKTYIASAIVLREFYSHSEVPTRLYLLLWVSSILDFFYSFLCTDTIKVTDFLRYILYRLTTNIKLPELYSNHL